ncbi:ribosomal RNA small subunit methyltransferase A [Patescibacteria group bacterium]|nr:ribosomal RNA small subunit methyltransferase A [Patescibacteria group bacterium]MBU1921977.1 ribosomal RNA small subunit methyltransferase A [Patescibacteria group bacterium]
MNFDTPAKVKEICKKYGFRPQRARGQNFLIDKNIIAKIIERAALAPQDSILEIGPGLGVLTAALAGAAKKVLAVEQDKKLFQILSDEFNLPNVKFINSDILKISNQKIAELLGSKEYEIVSNLPFQITSSIFEKFLANEPRPKHLIFMIQREVAERVIAASPRMNLLALFVQFHARAQILFRVGKNSFWPIPKVDSAVIELVPKSSDVLDRALGRADINNFWHLVKMGYRSKRKYLFNNLVRYANISKSDLALIFGQLGMDPKIRAQNLDLQNWLDLAKKIQQKG